MEWQDRGIVLAARKHGESSRIVTLLTAAHGRHVGLVRGGAGRRARGVLEPGNEVEARWRARLEAHLGTFTFELLVNHGAALLDDPLRLAGLTAACAMADASLPEREPHGAIYRDMRIFLAMLATPRWPEAYVRWELGLLAQLGFGLDLSACAATGRRDRLVYVSPKTGRAVSSAAGAPYRSRLLPLPAFLLALTPAEEAGEASEGVAEGAPAGEAGAASEGVAEAAPAGETGEQEDAGSAPPPGGFAPVPVAALIEGLTLTGYFLEHHVFAPQERGLPAARIRLVDRIRVSDTISRVREEFP